MGLRAWQFLAGHGQHESVADDFAALDLADVDVALSRIDHEHAGAVTALVMARVQQAGRRGVPVREVRRGPVEGKARVLFGDRSSLIVQGAEPGDLGRLAVMVLNHRAVRILAWRRHDDGVLIRLGRDRGPAFECLAVGLDQAD